MSKMTSDEILELLYKRIQENAHLIALEKILTADVNMRRQYEHEFERVGLKLESVRVEAERHIIQEEAKAVREEIKSIIQLLLRAIENEQTNQ